jgi:hypothetical protein
MINEFIHINNEPADSGLGDTLKVSMDKINQNFLDIINNFSQIGHGHTISEIVGLQTALTDLLDQISDTVTLDTAQTITGDKTFEGDLILGGTETTETPTNIIYRDSNGVLKVTSIDNLPIVTALSALSDVDLDTLADGEALVWNGITEKWENKVISLSYIAEDIANKSTDVSLDGDSDIKYPSVKSVKDYVDGQITLNTTPDATDSTKGKLKLTNDLGGTADLPTVPGLALKEDLANKSQSITTDATSTVKYPSVKAIKDYTDTALNNKVDKVAGKGLSTEDYTTAEKAKLASIANGAEVNVQADFAQTNTSSDDFIKNKPNMALYELKANKGVANGYAPLNSATKIPSQYLSFEAVNLLGKWNASTNVPTLANGTGSNGDFYLVEVAGTFNGVAYSVGDAIVYFSSTGTWEKIGRSDTISSVNGMTGEVILDFVDRVNAQSINGVKTFEDGIKLPNTIETTGAEYVLVTDSSNNQVRKQSITSLGGGGGAQLVTEEFTFTSSQGFITAQTIGSIFSVSVNGQELSNTQYSFATNVLTIVDTLEAGDYIRVLYSGSTQVGVPNYYSKSETDKLLARDWMSLARGFSSIPVKLADLPGGGMIWQYKYNSDNVTLYRRIQDGGLDDGFYEGLSGTTVSNLISKKQITYI